MQPVLAKDFVAWSSDMLHIM